MDAAIESYLSFVTKANFRYVIPIYQRAYSWDEAQCAQLWEDVVNVGRSETATHFTGSVVWVNNDAIAPGGKLTPLMLIDGQQRTTTLTLLLIALAEFARDGGGVSSAGGPLDFSFDDLISDGYLIKERKTGDDRYRILLSEADRATLCSHIESLITPSTPLATDSRRIVDNLAFFREKVRTIGDQNVVWNGLLKLKVISVRLDKGQDNPQLVFESMNSTGKSLRQADLIRNYVLMGQSIEDQQILYTNYWRPIERLLDVDGDDAVFDNFMRDFLTVRLAPTVVKIRDIYSTFKRMVERGEDPITKSTETLLAELLRYATLYARICLGGEPDDALKRRFESIKRLDVGIANMLLLSFYDDCEQGEFEKSGLLELVTTVESYILRRAICGYPTNSLNKFFPSLISKMDAVQESDDDYIDAFHAIMEQESGSTTRFPADQEFSRMLAEKDLYGSGKAFYLLSTLENSTHEKNPTDFANGIYTIEHVMPQNALAHDEWLTMLGENAESVHASLVHNIGNLTLTAYNSELSDGTFAEKKERMTEFDVIGLSRSVLENDAWNESAILSRRDWMVSRACNVWTKPVPNPELVAKYSKRKAGSHAKTKVVLREIFEAGLLKPGDILYGKTAGKGVEAVITEDGKIRIMNGEEFSAPTPAAVRTVKLEGGAGTRNGWSFWRIALNDELYPLWHLKDLYRGEAAKAPSIVDIRTEFWGGFHAACAADERFTEAFGDMTRRAENPDSWQSLGLGISERWLNAVVRRINSSPEIGVRACFENAEAYEPYWDKKDEISPSLAFRDAKPQWSEIDDPTKKMRIVSTFVPCSLNTEDGYEKAYADLIALCLAYRSTFSE